MNRQERRRLERERAAALKRPVPTVSQGQLLDLGLAHQRAGRLDQAEAVYLELLAHHPGDVNVRHLLGVIFLVRGDKAGALEWFRKAIAVKPDHVDAAIFSGLTLRDLGRLDEAAQALARAMALRPSEPTVHNDMGVVQLSRGEARSALDNFAAAVALKPNWDLYWRNYILTHNLVDGIAPTREREMLDRWSRQAIRPLRLAATDCDNDRSPDRRLRVGYFGGRLFGFHTQSNAFLPLIEHHDASVVDVVCYSDLAEAEEDPITRRYRAGSTWRCTNGLDDAQFADLVRRDRVDVLIDTVGLVESSRLAAMARRPAPITAMFPPMMTLGGDAVDYVIADDHVLPRESEPYMAERVERVPLVYRWMPFVPAPDIARARPSGQVVFGSANKLSKVSPETMSLWARVLAAVPGSRLLIKANTLNDTVIRQRYMDRLAAAGIEPGRIELRGWTPSVADHLSVYNEIDVMLDTAPYGGVTTTCEALWMGVPVVTLVGQRILGRYGMAFLRAVGLDEGVALTADDYVARAKAWAENADRRHELHRTLRARMAASPLCDGVSGAHDLEAAYRRMWHRWCQS